MLKNLIQYAKPTPDSLLIQWGGIYLEQKRLTFHLRWHEYPGHNISIFIHAWWISIPFENQTIKNSELITLTLRKGDTAERCGS